MIMVCDVYCIICSNEFIITQKKNEFISNIRRYFRMSILLIWPNDREGVFFITYHACYSFFQMSSLLLTLIEDITKFACAKHFYIKQINSIHSV